MSSILNIRPNLDAGVYVPKILPSDKNWRERLHSNDQYHPQYHLHFVKQSLQDIQQNTPHIQVSYIDISALKKPVSMEVKLNVQASIVSVNPPSPEINHAELPTKTASIEKKAEPKGFWNLFFVLFDRLFGIDFDPS